MGAATKPKSSPGYRDGARKVDAEDFVPDIGDWEEQHILHEFDDGWKIIEDVTEYDRRLMAKLTLTCVSSLIPSCLPGETLDQFKARVEKQQRKFYDTDYYRNCYSQEWIETTIQKQIKTYTQTRQSPAYRLAHLQDPEGRPWACILLVLEDAKLNPRKYNLSSYLGSDDLGQPHHINIRGRRMKLLECRIGTGKSASQMAEQYICKWYAETTGKWDEQAFKKAQAKRVMYTAVTYGHDELDRFRKGAKSA